MVLECHLQIVKDSNIHSIEIPILYRHINIKLHSLESTPEGFLNPGHRCQKKSI